MGSVQSWVNLQDGCGCDFSPCQATSMRRTRPRSDSMNCLYLSLFLSGGRPISRRCKRTHRPYAVQLHASRGGHRLGFTLNTLPQLWVGSPSEGVSSRSTEGPDLANQL